MSSSCLSMACACKAPFFLPGTSTGHGKHYQALPVDSNRGSGKLRTSAPQPRAALCPEVATFICFVLSGEIFEGAGKCALFLGILSSLGELRDRKDRKSKNHGCGKRRRQMKILMGSLSHTGWKGHPGLAEAKSLHAMSS